MEDGIREFFLEKRNSMEKRSIQRSLEDEERRKQFETQLSARLEQKESLLEVALCEHILQVNEKEESLFKELQKEKEKLHIDRKKLEEEKSIWAQVA